MRRTRAWPTKPAAPVTTVNTRLGQPVFELAVDQDEGDPAIAVGAVRPAMIGAALDDDVAGADNGLALVHDQHDLAVEDDAVIDRFGAMHIGVASVLRDGARGADLGEMRLALFLGQVLDVVALGRDVEDADARAVLR